MFDRLRDSIAGSVGSPAALSDARLFDAMVDLHRLEAVVAERKLALMAELGVRRNAQVTAGLPSGCWSSCGEELAESEVSAALTMGRAFAGSQVAFGLALRDRLPRVREALASGELDVYRARLIDTETRNVDDRHVAAVEGQVLGAIRGAAAGGGVGLTGRRLANAVRKAVVRVDPAGVRARRLRARRDRFVGTSPCEDAMVTLIGKLTAEDGRILEGRLREVANTVCPHDPRTFEQRKADALMVLIAGQSQLPCECGRVDCTQPVADAAPAARKALVHVLVHESTLRGEDDEPSYLDGYGIIDPDHARDLAKGAVVKPVKVPESADSADSENGASGPPTSDANAAGDNASEAEAATDANTGDGDGADGCSGSAGARQAKPRTTTGASSETAAPLPDSAYRYRPGDTLDTWMRVLFGTCAWPHCDVPAWDCDLDHHIPFDHENPAAGGPTTADNLTPYCRRHHRLKHSGHWRQHRRSGGDTDYTAPSRHTYRQPGASAFDLLDIDRGDLGPGGSGNVEPGHVEPGRAAPCPAGDIGEVGDTDPVNDRPHRRRRSRAQNRAARIHTERRLNQQRIDAAAARRERHLRIIFGHNGTPRIGSADSDGKEADESGPADDGDGTGDYGRCPF